MSAILGKTSVPLLPCPCCGGTDLHIEGDNVVPSWNVMCDTYGCEVDGPGMKCATTDAAAHAWNSRCPSTREVDGVKSCPFCGGTSFRIEDNYGDWILDCDECSGGIFGDHDTRESAVAAWNRRV